MRLPSQFVLGAAAVLAVCGLVAGGVGLRGRGAEVRASAHGFINDDRPGINAHNSPAAAAAPGRPDVVAVADRIDTPAFSCSVSLSTNGGVAWRGLDLPLPAGAPTCYWPDVAWAPDGDLLVLYTAMGGPNNQPVGSWLQRVRGRTPTGPPVAVAGANAFHARLAAAGDRVVAAWIQAGPATAARPFGFAPEPNPLVVATSADGGRTFSAPVTVSEAERLVTEPSLVVGPGGLVAVTALDLGADQLDYQALHQGQGGPADAGPWRVVAWSSRDGGATFGPTAVVSGDVVVPQRIYVDIGAPRPGLARDAAGGRLYATWESGAGADRDVFIARSDDHGATWSSPRPVVARPGTQTLPAVAVAPGGRVDVLLYDRSRDPTDVMTEVVLASSWDGGRTFTSAVVSPRRFDSRIGLGSFQGLPILGTNVEVLAREDGAVAFWSDTRRGTMDDNIQDLAVALVDIGRPRPTRIALALVGALLLAAAAAVLVAGRRRR